MDALSLPQRRVLFIALDAGLLLLSVWLSFWLRLSHPWHPSLWEVGGWMLPSDCS